MRTRGSALLLVAVGAALLVSPSVRAQEPAQAQEVQAERLATQLSNPVAHPHSVPFQFDRDNGVGTNGELRFARNGQPVVPFSRHEAGTGLATLRPIDG